MFPPAAHTERVATHDDVILLANPVVAADGKTVLSSIRVKKGQVRAARLSRTTILSNLHSLLIAVDLHSFAIYQYLRLHLGTHGPHIRSITLAAVLSHQIASACERRLVSSHDIL